MSIPRDLPHCTGARGQDRPLAVPGIPPAIYARITLGAREAGSEVPFGTPSTSCSTASRRRPSAHALFLVDGAPLGLDDDKVSKIYQDMTDLAFAEDARIVEGQQA